MPARAARVRPAAAAGVARPAWAGGHHLLPFDHAASFELRGQPGRLVQDVINVGPEGVFVATAIGYGFEEDRARPLPVQASGEQREAGRWLPGDLTLGQFPVDALIDGLRLNPRFDGLAFSAEDTGTAALLEQPLALPQLDQAWQRVRHVGGGGGELSFLFSLADSASGRELQDAPTHNIASLGVSSGERPFRPLAQPVQFLPRSTIRVQVEERSFDRRGTLFVVLYGYKVLTPSACPEPVQRAVQALVTPPPIEQTVPFDYVAALQLSGRPGHRLETEVTVSAEGAFVATALGYGLAAEDRSVAIDWAARWPEGDETQGTASPALKSRIDGFFIVNRIDPASQAPGRWPPDARYALADLPLRFLGPTALRDGFRIRPEYVHLALGGNGGLGALTGTQIERLFETLSRPEDVAFRYTLFDTGAGCELQDQPLHNVAGLGIANGDRPFKRFAVPLQLFPRATLRLRVEEVYGRGTLYFAFHGFKRLDGAGRRP